MIILKKLFIENFKGQKMIELSLSLLTDIFGANKAGKTTIADSVFWLLFNKNSQGEEKFQIRPLDSDGKQIDHIVITVIGTFEIDGQEFVLKKSQHQKWSTTRGTAIQEMKGNENKFEIDEIPKSEKDFKEFIDSMVPEEVFKLITNPQAFVSKKWKEQRDILLKLTTDVTDQDVINENPEYVHLREKLDRFTVAELTLKTQTAIKGLKDRKIEIPSRVDELSKQIVETDISAAELQKNALLEQITEAEALEEDSSKALEEVNQLRKEIMDSEFQISGVQQKANLEVSEKRRTVQNEVSSLKNSFNDLAREIVQSENEITRKKERVFQCTADKNKLVEQWKEVNALTFDEKELICTFCGQSFEKERQEHIQSEFEKNKIDKLDVISQMGLRLKTEIETLEKDYVSTQELIDALKATQASLETDIATVSKSLELLPTQADFTTNTEYNELMLINQSKKSQLEGMSTGAEYRQQLKIKKTGLREELESVQKSLNGVASNDKTIERIAELRAEEKELAQKIANQEQGLFLLECFTKAKMNLVSQKINSLFKVVNWKLFADQLNGGYTETCECTVNGVPYSSLNSAAKTQAGLDIINSLQKFYGKSAPIFIDNRESCTEIPKMDCQIINFYVSPSDGELRVVATC